MNRITIREEGLKDFLKVLDQKVREGYETVGMLSALGNVGPAARTSFISIETKEKGNTEARGLTHAVALYQQFLIQGMNITQVQPLGIFRDAVLSAVYKIDMVLKENPMDIAPYKEPEPTLEEIQELSSKTEVLEYANKFDIEVDKRKGFKKLKEQLLEAVEAPESDSREELEESPLVDSELPPESPKEESDD